MNSAAADWVYTVVLTRRYLESCGAIMWTGKGAGRKDEGHGAVMLRTCPCQWGPCGHCTVGRHHRCTHRRFAPTASPATYIQNPRGCALTPVWMVGQPCAWRCPCVCPAPALEQLVLFGEIGRQPKRHGQPDRNKPLHPLPPDLFDLLETTVEPQGKAADQ